MPYKDPEVRRVRHAQYRAANLEKIRAQQRERHATIREKKRAYRKAYYAANREAMLAQMREKHLEQPEMKRARSAAWRAANPEKAAAQRRRHRFLGRDRETIAYVEILRFDPCAYCGGPSGNADHITPRAQSGDDHWSNLTASCRCCNSSKNAKSLLPWLATFR